MTEAPAPADPFAPPEAATSLVDHREAVRHYGQASKAQRFANWLIDRVATVLLTIIVGAGVGLVYSAVTNEILVDSVGLDLGFRLGSAVVVLMYYVALEVLTGRTLGKWITGTTVIDIDTGSRPGLWKILGRSASRFVPFEPFSFLGDDGSGWHDKWSGTLVVRTRPTKNPYEVDDDDRSSAQPYGADDQR